MRIRRAPWGLGPIPRRRGVSQPTSSAIGHSFSVDSEARLAEARGNNVAVRGLEARAGLLHFGFGDLFVASPAGAASRRPEEGESFSPQRQTQARHRAGLPTTRA